MSGYKGYLIDLDGTVYRGNEPIPEAIDFINELKNRGISFLYVTNNSTTTPEKVALRLQNMGAPATVENVLTTSQATARFISQRKPGATVCFIGEEGLKLALEEEGLVIDEHNPDFVVVGLDRQVTYEKFSKAALAVRAGATFISTNSDAALVTERGLEPGNGSLTALVSTATGVDPIFIGKPEPIIVEQAIQQLNLSKEDCIMVGDNYHTDILAGLKAGCDTLFVSTGFTPVEELTAFNEQPTYILNTLKEWTNF